MADSLLEDNQSSDTQEREALLSKWKDKSPEELLKAKIESDLYIKSVTARFDDLKKDYLELRERQQASADLKDLIDQIKKSSNSDTSNTPKDTIQTPAIKPEEFKSLVAEEIVSFNKLTKQQENFKLAQDKLKQHFGENYQSAYKQRLEQFSLTPEIADDMAKNHPQLFSKTFDLDVQQIRPSDLSPPKSQQRQTSFVSTQKRDWSYYQELKKSNPKLYLDPKIAIQMHNDAIELGAAFGMPE